MQRRHVDRFAAPWPRKPSPAELRPWPEAHGPHDLERLRVQHVNVSRDVDHVMMPVLGLNFTTGTPITSQYP
jgi:hypothetical protein